MTLNVTIELFVLLYLGRAALPQKFSTCSPCFCGWAHAELGELASQMLGKGVCGGALWKALMVTVHLQRDHSHLVGSPAPLLPSCLLCSINICLAGLLPSGWQLCQLSQQTHPGLAHPCSHLRVLCSSCQLGRGSLEPGMLLNTTEDLFAPSPLPLPR